MVLVSCRIVEKFDRDAKTGKLLWFSGPPIRPTPPSAYKPRHSLAYLTFLASKKKGSSATSEPQPGQEEDREVKRRRVDVDGVNVVGTSSPSIRQLLGQWRQNPDGSFVQVGVGENPSSLASPETSPAEILIKSMHGEQRQAV